MILCWHVSYRELGNQILTRSNKYKYFCFYLLRSTRYDKVTSLHVQINSMAIAEREWINQTKKPLYLLFTEN